MSGEPAAPTGGLLGDPGHRLADGPPRVEGPENVAEQHAQPARGRSRRSRTRTSGAKLAAAACTPRRPRPDDHASRNADRPAEHLDRRLVRPARQATGQRSEPASSSWAAARARRGPRTRPRARRRPPSRTATRGSAGRERPTMPWAIGHHEGSTTTWRSALRWPACSASWLSISKIALDVGLEPEAGGLARPRLLLDVVAVQVDLVGPRRSRRRAAPCRPSSTSIFFHAALRPRRRGAPPPARARAGSGARPAWLRWSSAVAVSAGRGRRGSSDSSSVGRRAIATITIAARHDGDAGRAARSVWFLDISVLLSVETGREYGGSPQQPAGNDRTKFPANRPILRVHGRHSERSRRDLHFHLLPGVDDGPATLAESVALARAAARRTATIVATPQSGPTCSPRRSTCASAWPSCRPPSTQRASRSRCGAAASSATRWSGASRSSSWRRSPRGRHRRPLAAGRDPVRADRRRPPRGDSRAARPRLRRRAGAPRAQRRRRLRRRRRAAPRRSRGLSRSSTPSRLSGRPRPEARASRPSAGREGLAAVGRLRRPRADATAGACQALRSLRRADRPRGGGRPYVFGTAVVLERAGARLGLGRWLPRRLDRHAQLRVEAVADAEVGVDVAPAGETASSFWRTLRMKTSTERSPWAIV